MKQYIPFKHDLKCDYYILCAVDFYNQKGKNVITITDIQNFIHGRTSQQLKEHANWLIEHHYINGIESEYWKEIKLYNITELGQEYFDEL